MNNRVTEILIGKDISRDAQVVAGIDMTTLGASTGLADGELVVLDKNMLVMAAGSTIADTDTIYIAQGTGTTFSITNEAGTITTGNRRITLSKPIEGSQVKSYLGESYTAKVEQVWLLDIDDVTATVTVGTEYVLRLVYSDITEYPTRFTQSYRWVATAATEGALIWALAQAVNNHKHTRITAEALQSDGSTPATGAANANQLRLTSKEIPSCTTSLNDIDAFSMVEFNVYINYVDSNGHEQVLIAQSDGTDTANVKGHGNWEQVRDTEKLAMGYDGVSNFTHFPVVKPDFETVVDDTYHQIVIEHNPTHLSPYPSDQASDPVTTVIACVVPSSGTQLTSLLAQLNPWMASCPGAFANVSF
jgi:hypothetical protein